MEDPSCDYSPEEIALMEGIDDAHRLWPRADGYEDPPGEWTLTIRGTEEEFAEVHRGLTRAGYWINDEDESYSKDPTVL